MIKFKPTEDRILVEPILQETTTSGIVTEKKISNDNPPVVGIVIDMGKGRRNEQGVVVPMPEYLLGKKIHFQKFTGAEVTIVDKESLIPKKYWLVRISGVLGYEEEQIIHTN